MLALLLAAVLQKPIGPPPAEVVERLKLDPFYKKCIMVGDLPIVSSQKVSDRALREAERQVRIMTNPIPKALQAMADAGIRVAIMAESEQTTDIPEHSDLNRAFPQTDWNKRARGLGATKARPAISGAEENLLQLKSDRYLGEAILLHEFAHTIMEFGLVAVDPEYMPALQKAFDNAKAKGLWKDTYASSNINEYWAEAVQSYFDANRSADPPDGIHNNIDTREELKAYDPMVYAIIAKHFPSEWRWEKEPRVSGTSATAPTY